jgi:hypothetical protein
MPGMKIEKMLCRRRLMSILLINKNAVIKKDDNKTPKRYVPAS